MKESHVDQMNVRVIQTLTLFEVTGCLIELLSVLKLDLKRKYPQSKFSKNKLCCFETYLNIAGGYTH